MKKSVMAGVFGISTSIAISMISSYSIANWQWWAAVLPILIIGVIYANTPRK